MTDIKNHDLSEQIAALQKQIAALQKQMKEIRDESFYHSVILERKTYFMHWTQGGRIGTFTEYEKTMIEEFHLHVQKDKSTS